MSTRHCPNCGLEYLASVRMCSDCGLATVDTPPATPGPGGGQAGESIVYDLSEWERMTLAFLDEALTKEGIPHTWEGDDLVVPAVFEPQVEITLDRFEYPDQLEGEEMTVDELRAAEVLSALFIAADKIERDPTSSTSIGDMVRLAEEARALAPPFGVAAPMWDEARMWAAVVRADLMAQVDLARVRSGARRLRELLRPVV